MDLFDEDNRYFVENRNDLLALQDQLEFPESIGFSRSCNICLRPREEKLFCYPALRQLKLNGLTFKRNALEALVKALRKTYLKEALRIWEIPELSSEVYKFLYGCNVSETLTYLDLFRQTIDQKSVTLLGKALSTNTILERLELTSINGVGRSSLSSLWTGLNGVKVLDVQYQNLLEVDCIFLGRKILDMSLQEGKGLRQIIGSRIVENQYKAYLLGTKYRLKMSSRETMFKELGSSNYKQEFQLVEN